MVNDKASRILDNANGLLTRDSLAVGERPSDGQDEPTIMCKPSLNAGNAGIDHYSYKEMIMQGELSL